ncbi:MAG: bifunctional serine/threonine-protein kinase/formylglycine-generating enzyme family protein [Pirellulaceae bacterium]
METWIPPNRYTDVRPLTQGGMGELYVAGDTETGNDVVIKRPRQDTRIAVDRLEERFQREQDLLLSVSHAKIVKVVEVGRHNGHLFIVTERVDGNDLRKTLDVAAPLEVTEAYRILDSVCEAVDHLHRLGILHRDLQPGNVLLGSDGSIKVTDFGIAVPLQGLGQMTQTGEVLGTADYMSPEQRHRLPMDERGDQYSIGAIAYEMLTGNRAAGLFGPPSQTNPNVPLAVDSVIMRSLSRDPDERFASVAQFRQQLQSAIEQSENGLRARPALQMTYVVLVGAMLIANAAKGLLWMGAGTSINLQPPDSMRWVQAPLESEQVQDMQQQWADYLNMPVVQENSIDMQLVLIPPGEFLMGATDDDVESDPWSDPSTMLPRHRVRITQPFLIGAYEVTVGQFRQFVVDQSFRTDAEWGRAKALRTNALLDSQTNKPLTWRNPGFDQSEQHPVVQVTWNDAVAFCNWLSDKENATYRLITEAEWEYACRAGTYTPWSFGNSFTVASDYVWAKAGNDRTWPTTIVGSPRKPNAFGLFDMHGNAKEWCLDGFNPEAYRATLAVDPLESKRFAESHVTRGGGSTAKPWFLRSSVRKGHHHETIAPWLGFRVAREIDISGTKTPK